jgi:phage gp29-like protein
MNRADGAPPSQFTPGQQALEDMADTMLAADPLVGNEELIATAVEGAASFEEAMERVLELYPRLDMSRLQEDLAVSLANAELLGRKEVQDGH